MAVFAQQGLRSGRWEANPNFNAAKWLICWVLRLWGGPRRSKIDSV
jgi:hypothetical protein